MKIVFVSNFLNHHQLPLSEAFIDVGVDYKFIATTPLPEEQKNLGYENMNEACDFVVCTYKSNENYELAKKLCNEADVVIIGSAPIELVKERINQKKLTFIYSERIYKLGVKAYKLPLHFIKFRLKQYGKKNVHLLCASAFVAADYAKSHTFLNRAYKWGYFPEIRKYDDIDGVISKKKKNSIVWAGRLIDYKRPEIMLDIANMLKKDGYNFEIIIIGNGEKYQLIEELIVEKTLQNEVRLLGSMSPDEVRSYMERSEIFAFTSNREEGWGAVLNEAMNSGCAVVASHIIGSVPFLIKDKENGIIYKDGDTEDLYKKIKFLFDNPEKKYEFGRAAYRTLNDEWNAKVAAANFIKLAEQLSTKDGDRAFLSDGICSKAQILSDDWY